MCDDSFIGSSPVSAPLSPHIKFDDVIMAGEVVHLQQVTVALKHSVVETDEFGWQL